jgi:hypothetical protein
MAIGAPQRCAVRTHEGLKMRDVAQGGQAMNDIVNQLEQIQPQLLVLVTLLSRSGNSPLRSADSVKCQPKVQATNRQTRHTQPTYKVHGDLIRNAREDLMLQQLIEHFGEHALVDE